jgi:hypothetical protein
MAITTMTAIVGWGGHQDSGNVGNGGNQNSGNVGNGNIGYGGHQDRWLGGHQDSGNIGYGGHQNSDNNGSGSGHQDSNHGVDHLHHLTNGAPVIGAESSDDD